VIEDISEEQKVAARLIAVGTSISAVAKVVGVSASSIRRWYKMERFKKCVAELLQNKEPPDEEEDNGTERQSDELLPLAMQSLMELLKKGSPTSKLGAAKLVVQLYKLSQPKKGKGVTMNEAVFEAATQMLVELFRQRDDLRKEALIELEKIHRAEEVSPEAVDE
jgi:hypothetical protein